MKIEIDTNKDTHRDWQQAKEFIDTIYLIRAENRKKTVTITPDQNLVDRVRTPGSYAWGLREEK